MRNLTDKEKKMANDALNAFGIGRTEGMSVEDWNRKCDHNERLTIMAVKFGLLCIFLLGLYAYQGHI
jgi:hypothetical protein